MWLIVTVAASGLVDVVLPSMKKNSPLAIVQ
jgi:hypothetical protein